MVCKESCIFLFVTDQKFVFMVPAEALVLQVLDLWLIRECH